MKISVITLHTASSYGSVLQTYATQTILENMDNTVEFVDYWRNNNRISVVIDDALKSAAMQQFKYIWDANELFRKLVRIPVAILLERKRAPMKKFLKKRIHLTKTTYYSFQELLNNVPQADIYMTGSDQVWNSVWNGGIEKPFFLEYAPEGKPRIAFAASIGRKMLDEEEIPPTQKMLKKYSYISMREKSGVELLESLGIYGELILDPTLMLEACQWHEIMKPYSGRKPYLFIYQLNPNPEMDRYAKELGKRKNWEIIRLSDGYSDRKKEGYHLVCPSVEKLLGCLAGASCVLTDSFHATAFSLNLSKNFISVLPERFGARIEDILSLTQTQYKLLKDYSDYTIADQEIDYGCVQKILAQEREKGKSFLKTAIHD